MTDQSLPSLPVDNSQGLNTESSMRGVLTWLSEEETRALLQDVPPVYRTEINDTLLTALAQTLCQWCGERRVLIEMEGHGREELFEHLDISRTVGWFTSLYPLVLDLRATDSPASRLKAIKEQLRCVPRRGVGYGLLRYLTRAPEAEALRHSRPPELLFNYLGQLDDMAGADGGLLELACEPSGRASGAEGARTHLLEVVAAVVGGRLRVEWRYSQKIHREETIEGVASGYLRALRELIEHCRAAGAGGFTPSDFPLARLNQKDLDHLLGDIGQ